MFIVVQIQLNPYKARIQKVTNFIDCDTNMPFREINQQM